MPKQVRHDQNVILNSVQNLVLNFDIHLIFACLREAASARAGNLAFGIALVEIMVCPLRQLIETSLQENSFFLKMGPVPILIDLDRVSPDKYAFGKRAGEEEPIPGVEDLLFRGAEGQRNDSPPCESGQLDHPNLDSVAGSSRSVRNNGDIAPLGLNHLFETGETFSPGRTQDGTETKPYERLSHHLAIPMGGNEKTQRFPFVDYRHHE